MSDARLHIEAIFKCPSCGGVPYKLYRVSTAEHPDVFTHRLWPTDASLPPPMEAELRCPTDQTVLVRTAA